MIWTRIILIHLRKYFNLDYFILFVDTKTDIYYNNTVKTQTHKTQRKEKHEVSK